MYSINQMNRQYDKSCKNISVAEPISTSTPQMIYKVKCVSNDSQKTMKETKVR